MNKLTFDKFKALREQYPFDPPLGQYYIYFRKLLVPHNHLYNSSSYCSTEGITWLCHARVPLPHTLSSYSTVAPVAISDSEFQTLMSNTRRV